MSDEQTIKFPLTKKQKAEFADKYEKIFFKKPVHNMSDEKLVEIVNANLEKIGQNDKTSNEPPQEGIQNEENKSNEGEGVDSATKEREFQFDKYLELHGKEADGNLATDEVTALNVAKENKNFEEASNVYLELFGKTPLVDYSTEKIWDLIAEERKRIETEGDLKQRYFDLFGKTPLTEMTSEQILSAIDNEEARQAEAKSKSTEAKKPKEIELEHDPETEMIVANKKNPNDKRVINKGTFDFIKADFDAVAVVPKELKNK